MSKKHVMQYRFKAGVGQDFTEWRRWKPKDGTLHINLTGQGVPVAVEVRKVSRKNA